MCTREVEADGGTRDCVAEQVVQKIGTETIHGVLVQVAPVQAGGFPRVEMYVVRWGGCEVNCDEWGTFGDRRTKGWTGDRGAGGGGNIR